MKTLASLCSFLLLYTSVSLVQAQCPNPIPVIVLPDTTAVLNTDSVELDAGPDGLTYFWNTGAVTRKIKVGQNGKYKVTVSLSGGICGTDSTQVFLLKGLTVKDTSVCPDTKLVLQIKSSFDNIQWTNGRLGNIDTFEVNTNMLVQCSMLFGRYYFTDACIVRLHPLPDNTISYPRKVFCPNDTVLQLSCAPATLNQWYVNDTLLGSGNIFKLKTLGRIKMKAINQYGCNRNSDTIFIGNAVPFKAKAGSLLKNLYCELDTIEFSDSSDLDTLIYQRKWDFKDYTFSSEKNPNHSYEQSGLFNVSLTYTDSNGCKDSSVNTFNVSSKPIVSFVASQPNVDTTIRQFICTAIPMTLSYYLWDISEGTIDLGQGSPQITCSLFMNKATLKMIATDANGCSGSFSDKLHIIFSGVNFLTESGMITIFPNPSNGTISINHKQLSNDPVLFQVYNLTGAEVMYERGNANQTFVTDLPSGVYVAKLTIDGNSSYSKMVIAR